MQCYVQLTLRDRAGQVLPSEAPRLHRGRGCILGIYPTAPYARAQLYSFPGRALVFHKENIIWACLADEWDRALAGSRGRERQNICPTPGSLAGRGKEFRQGPCFLGPLRLHNKHQLRGGALKYKIPFANRQYDDRREVDSTQSQFRTCGIGDLTLYFWGNVVSIKLKFLSTRGFQQNSDKTCILFSNNLALLSHMQQDTRVITLAI